MGEQTYIPIVLNSVVINTVVDFDLFFLNHETKAFVLYRSRNTHFTEKNRRNDPGRMELMKYCARCRKHTMHRETK